MGSGVHSLSPSRKPGPEVTATTRLGGPRPRRRPGCRKPKPGRGRGAGSRGTPSRQQARLRPLRKLPCGAGGDAQPQNSAVLRPHPSSLVKGCREGKRTFPHNSALAPLLCQFNYSQAGRVWAGATVSTKSSARLRSWPLEWRPAGPGRKYLKRAKKSRPRPHYYGFELRHPCP